jgi:hypothetical protein
MSLLILVLKECLTRTKRGRGEEGKREGKEEEELTGKKKGDRGGEV